MIANIEMSNKIFELVSTSLDRRCNTERIVDRLKFSTRLFGSQASDGQSKNLIELILDKKQRYICTKR